MKGVSSTKLMYPQPSSNHKNGGNGISNSVTYRRRIWLVAFLSFFAFVSILTLHNPTWARDPSGLPSSSSSSHAAVASAATATTRATPLPAVVFDALVHYAVASNYTWKMEEDDVRAIAGVLRRRGPCNLLVFGIGRETPLWRALNQGGRTVFVDESQYYCRPVQNLLFSDCRLAINDLPNQLYDVAWDVILIDGPKGYEAAAPGRMSAIFTAAVMARYRGRGHVDVLVHDYDRAVERLCSAEFLCSENLVAATSRLAHFLIRTSGGPANEFCSNGTTTAYSAATSSS
ncbi:hypothetical protein B296_00051705 [Ensete ventricosum]|uniref:Polysaccharide biosynthesis domain-containing protein n=1 Tax=Ensete ventricosum TaxID=4639 RepID=A0A426XDF9_ENSVE|nr:hypothetical protein B296_00051705 [Ensete ventricosum]